MLRPLISEMDIRYENHLINIFQYEFFLSTTGYHSSKRIDSSGRSIKGRGFMWYTEKSRSRSHTPPHWRSAVEDRKSRHTDKEKHNNTREDLHLGRHERQRHDDHQTESILRHKYQSRSRSPDNHRSIITKHKENNVSNISQKSHPSSSSPPRPLIDRP
ncbi:unnamed protein product, partial [Rotaria sp. Silwood2]